MAKKDKSSGELEPQKSSAAQFITYIASTGQSSEKYELRYEDENIWMSQKTLAAVYGVEVPNIAYHLKKLYDDAEVDQVSTIKEILIVAGNGKNYSVKHYNLQVVIALGFKIDNERAVQFRKWANEIVSHYTIRGYVIDKPRMKDGSPISSKQASRERVGVHRVESCRIRVREVPHRARPALHERLRPLSPRLGRGGTKTPRRRVSDG